MSSLDIWLNVSTCADILLLSHAGWQQFHVIILASSEQHPCDLCFVFFYLLGSIDDTNVVPKLQRSQDGSEDREDKGSSHGLEKKHTQTHSGINMWHQLYITVILMRDTPALSDITDHFTGDACYQTSSFPSGNGHLSPHWQMVSPPPLQCVYI